MGIATIKYIPDYERLYSISETGKIYSHISNKYLKHNIMNNGYASVELFKNKNNKRLLVHRLVAQTYISNPNNFPEVNHKDENKLNNNASNLEWCTSKYNMNYGNGAKTRHSKIDYSKETYKINARKNGKKVSKPIIQYSLNGTFIKEFESAKQASREYDYHAGHISECCKGKLKTSNGFKWKYKEAK